MNGLKRAAGPMLMLCVVACASDGDVQPPVVDELYAPVQANQAQARCAAINAEIEALERGLDPAVDGGLPEPAGAASRWGDYGKDLVVQTVIGPLQPIIQTVKAAVNYDDKNRLTSENHQRAEIRRAYLLGSLEGTECP